MKNRMYSTRTIVSLSLALAIAACVVATAPRARANDEKGEKAPAQKNAAFDVVKSLVGTWVSTPDKDQKSMTIVFKATSGGNTIMESMAPGTDEEMVDMYSADGQGVTLTHYCHMGNQPRMKLASMEKGVLKFEFVDAGNLASRDEPHMDSLELTINGDHLTEKWSMYRDGKVVGTHVFEFNRKG